MILPMVVMSGVMLNRPWAPLGPTLNPVMTSSKIKSAPLSWVTFLRASKNPGAGGTTPMFPATGSVMTAAIPEGWAAKNFSTDSMSLYSATKVSLA